MTPRKIVVVHWLDSKTWSNSWMDGADLKAADCCTVGILITNSGKQVVISQSSSEDGFLNVIAIPRGCIESMDFMDFPDRLNKGESV